MILTGIEKVKNKVYLIFDNAYKVELFYDVYLYFPIYKGDEVSDKKIEEMKITNAEYEIKNSAFRYLANRNHSTTELKRKLMKKEFNPELVQKVVDELISKNYLDDFRFAESFVRHRLERKKEGILKITAALYQKGISKNIIDEVISTVSEAPQLYINAFYLAEKKLTKLKNRNEKDVTKIKSKIFNFLRSRGFTNDLIFEVIKKLNLSED